MIFFSQLEAITGGKNLTFFDDFPVITLSTDSRKASVNEGVLFFAIKGERHDGHKHVRKLYEQGIRQFVVEYPPENINALKESNIIQVSSSIGALQSIAAFHRDQFTIPVIGITGSNGKTITKEWLFQMLSKDTVVVKNPGSYNSQIGVPLSVWQLQQHHQLGIFEAGISKPGEMQKLGEIIKPTIGIFTNIGPAHAEGFTSIQEKAKEKLKLFANVETVVYCKDHSLIDEAISSTSIRSFTWGRSDQSDVRVRQNADGYIVKVKNQKFKINLPFNDRASVENAFHCLTLMIHLGYSVEEIHERVNNLKAVPMRLELKEGINQCQVIDDTYNNDLGGIEISIQFLTHQQQKKKKTLILSDVLESGMKTEELVKKIATLVNGSGIHRFIGVGPALSQYQTEFRVPSVFFLSTKDFLEHFNTDQLQQEVILVKGARTFQFERIVGKLQRKVHGTIMEIDLGALVHNFNYFKSLLKSSAKIMVMVKAFAYGSGSSEIANILQYHQADYLGVAYTDEGVDLRKNNIRLPIMVMNPSEESFQQIIQYDLEPEIYSFKILHDLLSFLQGNRCKIHLKLDTGMHRLGFEEEDLSALIDVLMENRNIEVASIFSHLAGADDEHHDEFSRHQGEKFKSYADLITETLGYKPLYHLLNSPGILRFAHLQFDMVRLGVGLYGVDPTHENSQVLKPVVTLKTIISQIKRIGKGETIGYGRKGKAASDMIIGTIAIGYADGYSRSFSQGVGEVLVSGKRAKVIGNVCMDMTMIDLTEIGAKEGDEVIIFGKDLPIQEVAAQIHTIPYEILTNTSERVKRVFVAEGI